MSEMKHYKGKLIPTGKTVEEYFEGVEIPSYYETLDEYLEDSSSKLKLVNGQVFKVERYLYEDIDNIYESTKNEDGSIDFHVKYYDGGTSFGEALSEALD